VIRLGVNIDHVATVRQARGTNYPDPVQAALMAELGGADNITAHLREDRRHIQDHDIERLRSTINCPLNFEMACTPEMIKIAKKIKPHAVTLVPEKREERTTEGGLDLKKNMKSLSAAVATLQDAGMAVSLFVEPTVDAVKLSAKTGAKAVEFHTGHWCHRIDGAVTTKEKIAIMKPLQDAAKATKSLGIQCHFGHGIHYNNASWLQLIPEAEEANIGHAIIARALFVGLTTAVREMKDLLNNPMHRPYT
jgi:pyridoxine 5-phosphate synthase